MDTNNPNISPSEASDSRFPLRKGLILYLGLTILFFIFTIKARSQNEIVLGAATSLGFLEGRESLNAVQLAVHEINSRKGVRVGDNYYKLRVASVDLQGARPNVPVSQAVATLKNWIIKEKVHALVIGPFRSEVLLGAMDVIADHKIPLLGAIAMSTASDAKILKDPRYKYIFRVCLNTKYLVDYLINAMKYLRIRYGYNRVYILTQDVAWTRTTASLMVRLYFDRTDWQIIGVDHYSSSTTDFTHSLVKADKEGAQVILPLFDMPTSAAIYEQWHAMNSRALLFGFVSPVVGPGAWNAFGDKITGSLNVIFELGNIASNKWPLSVTFNKAYETMFSKKIEAGHGPAPAYESVYILAQAIASAGTLDPDAIVAALEKTDRTGVMGRIRFHRGHQAFFGEKPEAEALATIFQWQKDGTRKIVYPLSIADGEIEHPNPLQ